MTNPSLPNMTSRPRIIIVGGVAGGASAAARARRLSEDAEIILIERGPDVSFANCGLPYHIGGEIPDRSQLAVQTPAGLRAILNIEVRTRTEATAIDPERKTLRIRQLDDDTEDTLSFDSLILAPGASPIRPPLPGIEDPRIMTLRNLQDMDRIKEAAARSRTIAIIGAGFIGLEMAEQLSAPGKMVHLIELQPQVLPQLDPEMARPLAIELRNRGIDLHLADGITSFSSGEDAVSACLASGTTVEASLIVLCIGVQPENSLAKAAGLALGARGHVVVDQWQQTSVPGIYAVGDACETADPILCKRSAIPLGGPANRQGRTAADHIFRGDKALPYPGSLGTAIVRVFDLAAGVVGWTGKRLEAEGVSFQSVVVNAPDHAAYYPGHSPVDLKLLWSPEDGRILGAQAVGRAGIDKRLDIIATALRGRLTIDDLCHLELAYAPPFGSAKDVVNFAGFAACNIRDGLLHPIPSLDDAFGQIIDVRPPFMVEKQPFPGIPNIPFSQLRKRLDELDREQPVFTICQMGKTSYQAARVLANRGFDARSILGGANHLLD